MTLVLIAKKLKRGSKLLKRAGRQEIGIRKTRLGLEEKSLIIYRLSIIIHYY